MNSGTWRKHSSSEKLFSVLLQALIMQIQSLECLSVDQFHFDFKLMLVSHPLV